MNRAVSPLLAATVASAAMLALGQGMLAQTALPQSAAASTSSPVAYVYVSSNYSGSDNRTVGYAAAANGQLTQIAGSPWPNNISYLALNGTYLFGSTNIGSDNGRNIYSYRIESNGALKYVGGTNIQDTASANACNQAQNLLLDHTGSYLYAFVGSADCDTQEAYESFAVNKSTGLLGYLGVTDPNAFSLGSPLTMLADNNYAYAAGGEDSGICGFRRASNGNLTDLGSYNGSPVCSSAAVGTAGQPSGSDGNFAFATADTTNHLAVGTVYTDATSGSPIDNKVATIAINTSSGAQTTSSTYANMPSTDVKEVTALMMAPGGKQLAVGGSDGIQIFNFNPSGQATAATGLISTADITAMYWDNNGHVYAISNAGSALYVFTVTATDAVQAPGSPYTIAHPVAEIVDPK